MQVVTHDTQSSIDLNDKVFARDYNEGLVHQSVVTFLNNLRQGNSAQKTRSEVRGGGKKPWKQKGTGRARAGTIRSPIFRTGGVTFASKKRTYTQKLNKKMYTVALSSLLSELIRKELLVVVSDFQCATPKTKDLLNQLKSLNVESALIVVEELGENEYLASRNLSNYEVVDVIAVNPYLLLSFKKIVMTESALRKLEEQLS